MTLKIIMLSLRAIYNNKMRSFLTMLGIIIGVMAVVILVSITQNATSGITDSIASMAEIKSPLRLREKTYLSAVTVLRH